MERAAPLLLTVGFVSLLEVLATIGWSSPSCTRAYQSWNGPISATFGAPFPYVRWSLASSLQYLVMVHIYLANLFLLSCAAYPFSRRFVARAPRAYWTSSFPHYECTPSAFWFGAP